jgi:hypothetical protein
MVFKKEDSMNKEDGVSFSADSSRKILCYLFSVYIYNYHHWNSLASTL